MSRREDRSSDGKRRRISGFDRAPSPKRSRRDGNGEIGRAREDNVADKDRTVRDEKKRRQYEDVKPPDASLVKDKPKVETGTMRKEFERENDVYGEGVRRTSDQGKVSRPGSYFRHGDRAGADRNGRSLNRREDRGRGSWTDPREKQTGHEEFRTSASKWQQLKDKRTREKKEDNRAWRHDGYFEFEANPNRESRQPPFIEQKISSNPERPDKTASHPATRNPRSHDARSGHKDRETYRSEARNGARDRYDGGYSRYSRGRDEFSVGGQSYRSNGNRAEKWKHDLYKEANKSPTLPKNEEDHHIAKVEALLSS